MKYQFVLILFVSISGFLGSVHAACTPPCATCTATPTECLSCIANYYITLIKRSSITFQSVAFMNAEI